VRLEFKKRHRPVVIRMVDATERTVLVDDAKPVKHVQMVICDILKWSRTDGMQFALGYCQDDQNDANRMDFLLRLIFSHVQ
jgi:hypothetical protein